MKPLLPANVEYLFAELTNNYAGSITKYHDRFDVVVIDGRERVRCAVNSLGALKPHGVIIWDNTQREKYQPGFDFLKTLVFEESIFWE